MQFDREKLVIVLMLTSSILLWFYLTYLEDTVYTTSFNLDQTEQQTQQLHNVNILLRNQLLEDESYTHIASEAAKMGFTQKANPIYLK